MRRPRASPRARRGARRRRTRTTTSALAPPSAARACVPASIAATRGSGPGRQPAADAHAHRSDDTPRHGGAEAVRCWPSSGRPASARPRSRSRSPTGCARAASGRSRCRPTRCRSTAASRRSPASRRAPSRRASSTGSSRSCRSTRASAPASTPQLAHAEIDGLLAARRAADRRRRHRPVPARRARRPRRCARRRPTRCARAGRPSSTARGPRGAARRSSRGARRGRPRASSPRDRSRIVRALELLELGELEPRAEGPNRAVDRRDAPPDAPGRPRRWSARRCTRGSTRASTRWSPPAPSTRCARAHAAGASETARKALGLRGAAARATSRR